MEQKPSTDSDRLGPWRVPAGPAAWLRGGRTLSWRFEQFQHPQRGFPVFLLSYLMLLDHLQSNWVNNSFELNSDLHPNIPPLQQQLMPPALFCPRRCSPLCSILKVYEQDFLVERVNQG